MPRTKSKIERKIHAYYISPITDGKLKAMGEMLNLPKSQVIEALVDTYFDYVKNGGELFLHGASIRKIC